MIRNILLGILIIYLTISITLFISFYIFNYNASYTNLVTNEKITLTGIKRFGAFLLMSFAWPYTLITGQASIGK